MTTATSAQPGPLSSDHVNYLILRYLQEGGHEASATAFYRDWRRPAEFRDPEDLPFAPSVQRHELVSVIQDGLHHDELVSRVRNERRRFNFTTNGAGSSSRPGTSGKGKGRLEQVRRGTDEFPTPAPKRQRKSEEAPHERHINGATELMELDAASPSAGDAEEDAEAASPAVQTPEPEIVEIPERYDSMDVAVQTEGKIGPKTSTMYWRLDKPDATILHSTFSPAKGSRLLFTAGEGVSRYYDVPSDFESGVDKVYTLHDGDSSITAAVTACTWHPAGLAMAFAVDAGRDIGVGGKQERRQMVKSYDSRSMRTTQYHSPPLLEPAGIVMSLRYSWDGSKLLAVRTNGARATVEVWDTDTKRDSSGNHSTKLKAWNIFGNRVVDAAWIATSEFIVCGEDGLLEKFRVKSDEVSGSGSEETTTSSRMHGLEPLSSPSLSEEAQRWTFDKLAATVPGSSSETAIVSFVALASDYASLIIGSTNTDFTFLARLGAANSGHRLTALAFNPRPLGSYDDAQPSGGDLLVVADELGSFEIRKVEAGSNNGQDHESSPDSPTMCSCSLADGSPALTLAWSPEGSYLAVCGVDIVQIWETVALARAERHDGRAPEPIVTWRRDRSAALKDQRNGEHVTNGDGDEPLQAPSLSWSADGESLALAVGNEIAAIRFRPPLQDGREDGAYRVNGHSN